MVQLFVYRGAPLAEILNLLLDVVGEIRRRELILPSVDARSLNEVSWLLEFADKFANILATFVKTTMTC